MATIAILVGDGFEDSELDVPRQKLHEAGHVTSIIGPRAGATVRGKHGGKAIVEQRLDDRSPTDFDALLIPGGKGPEKLRRDEEIVQWVRDFVATGRPVAAVCHGPLLLVAADAVKGRDVTSWPAVRGEIEDAGARWVDAEVVEDGPFITSRKPEDIDAFSAALIDRLSAGTRSRTIPNEGVRNAEYGRQTHGGQNYGETGVAGQPIETTGDVLDAGEPGGASP